MAVLDRKKVVRISSKRQFTIPQKFYEAVGLTDQAECVLRGNELIIKPVKKDAGGEFAEQILAELIAEGKSGQELLDEFKKRQAGIKPAVGKMLAEAKAAAHGQGEYMTYEGVFGEE